MTDVWTDWGASGVLHQAKTFFSNSFTVIASFSVLFQIVIPLPVTVAANPPRLTAVQTAMLSCLSNAGQLKSDVCLGVGD